EIKSFSERGGAVFGICGGYQMLGESLFDPAGTELGGKMEGLGLLPAQTVFYPQKIRKQSSGEIGALEGIFSSLSGLPFSGYEIHMGKTSSESVFAQKNDGEADGAFSKNTYGTYIHGIFDEEEIASAIVSALAHKKGIKLKKPLPLGGNEYKNAQFDLLADALRQHMDIEKIYSIAEAGI
ncbi:MAG: cobyric acid synthase CobQ, partial [Firmicutes bacterium]|nr:cobyric acid synthase CobQ [Bacillota bacterium]